MTSLYFQTKNAFKAGFQQISGGGNKSKFSYNVISFMLQSTRGRTPLSHNSRATPQGWTEIKDERKRPKKLGCRMQISRKEDYKQPADGNRTRCKESPSDLSYMERGL